MIEYSSNIKGLLENKFNSEEFYKFKFAIINDRKTDYFNEFERIIFDIDISNNIRLAISEIIKEKKDIKYIDIISDLCQDISFGHYLFSVAFEKSMLISILKILKDNEIKKEIILLYHNYQNLNTKNSDDDVDILYKLLQSSNLSKKLGRAILSKTFMFLLIKFFFNTKILSGFKSLVIDDTKEIRKNAVLALDNFEDSRCVAILKKMIFDSNEEIRQCALSSLKKYYSDEEIEEVINKAILENKDFKEKAKIARNTINGIKSDNTLLNIFKTILEWSIKIGGNIGDLTKNISPKMKDSLNKMKSFFKKG